MCSPEVSPQEKHFGWRGQKVCLFLWQFCFNLAAAPSVAEQTELVDDCYQGTGTSYRGTMALTISGKKCQAWNAMTPHAHTKTPEALPNAYVCLNFPQTL